MKIEDLKIGATYTRDDLKSAFGGSFMRGMNYCSRTNTLVLISKHTSSRIYGDSFVGGKLVYTGEGQKGDQTLTGQNKRLAESNVTRIPVYLFIVYEPQVYTYYGIVKLVDEVFYENEPDIEGNLRKVVRFNLVRENELQLYEADASRYIKPTYNVVGAAISNDKNEILCAQRGYGDLKGKWEFPGGKIERNETPEEALYREIREELKLSIAVNDKIDESRYDYGEYIVNLSVFSCKQTGGSLNDTEHMNVKWVKKINLGDLDWADADEPIVEAILDSLELEIADPPLEYTYYETASVSQSDREINRAVQDYIRSQQVRMNAGNKAEIAVIKYEKDKLNNLGRPDLADLVKQVSLISSDYGYDVRSYELVNGQTIETHIEVKSAKLSNNYIEFYITQNEYDKFKNDPNHKIYCLFRRGRKYNLHIVNKNEFGMQFMDPMTYKVKIRITE